MRAPYFLTSFRFYPYPLKSIRYGLSFFLIGLLWACNLGQPTDLEQTQADNMRLTKTLHTHLNHHDWQAVEKLCAQTVRYRGRATHFVEGVAICEPPDTTQPVCLIYTIEDQTITRLYAY
ncbi:hypothetical protein GCM10028805_17100 [Spirosoma harenae]